MKYVRIPKVLYDTLCRLCEKDALLSAPMAPTPPTTEELQQFLLERCEIDPDAKITFKVFYEAFQAWLPPEEKGDWSKIKTSRALPKPLYTRRGTANVVYIHKMRLK